MAPEARSPQRFTDVLTRFRAQTLPDVVRKRLCKRGPRLMFQAEPPPRLEGIAWEVTGFNNGRNAVVSPVLGTAPTLSFEAGVVTGHSGCNSFRASYTGEGNRVAIGPAALTRKACPGDGIMDQERELVAALESAKTWTVRDGLLDLYRADEARALTASAPAR